MSEDWLGHRQHLLQGDLPLRDHPGADGPRGRGLVLQVVTKWKVRVGAINQSEAFWLLTLCLPALASWTYFAGLTKPKIQSGFQDL